MKKTLISLFVFCAFLGIDNVLISQTVNVTFRVDMQDEIVSGDGIHMAGSFTDPHPNWDPAGIQLTQPMLGAIYDTTLILPVGSYYEFKYINGNAWGQDEGVPSACAQNGNRYITVPDTDTILDVVCFGKCVPCVLPPVDITFQVDMTNEEVSTDGVHIAGSVNGWNTVSDEMLHIGNNVYEITLTLGEGESHEYKYLNGNDWGTDESVPIGCAQNSNRYFTVPSANQTLPLVCFGSCDPCTTVTDINVTFRVDMSEQEVSPLGVHVAGSFQGWNTEGTLMTDMGNGIWEHSDVVQSGEYHEYKYINGITWDEGENVPWFCNQNNNRFLTVPDNDTILPAYCFSSCLVCNPPQVDVTFQVDMSLMLISENGVHLMGNFQGWDPASTLMTDAGNKIYEVTLTLDEGEFYEYKFLNGDTYDDAEWVPVECSSLGGNRQFFGPTENTTLDVVCFGWCDPCVIPTNTFDIKVYLQGPFSGTEMNLDLNNEGVFPVNQPYNIAPWNYIGEELYSGPPQAKVVDWVLLEFRYSTFDAAGASSDNKLNEQAAILLADGKIVQPDGVSLPEYTGPTYADVYVVVWHRNHLGVMSALKLEVVEGDFVYDFTDDLTKAYLDGQNDLGDGNYGMISGDSDGSGEIDDFDKVDEWSVNAGAMGYLGPDLNMDTQVNNQDKDEFWLPNYNLSTSVPD